VTEGRKRAGNSDALPGDESCDFAGVRARRADGHAVKAWPSGRRSIRREGHLPQRSARVPCSSQRQGFRAACLANGEPPAA